MSSTPQLWQVAAVALALAWSAGCRAPDDPRRPVPGGDAERGEALLFAYGCTSCHTIPTVPGAHAVVGPPLWAMGDRAYIAGVLPNTPDDMIRWLQDPQGVNPRTAMPDVGASETDARDMTAFLFTLRAEPLLVRLARGIVERATGRQVAEPAGTTPGGPL